MTISLMLDPEQQFDINVDNTTAKFLEMFPTQAKSVEDSFNTEYKSVLRRQMEATCKEKLLADKDRKRLEAGPGNRIRVHFDDGACVDAEIWRTKVVIRTDLSVNSEVVESLIRFLVGLRKGDVVLHEVGTDRSERIVAS